VGLAAAGDYLRPDELLRGIAGLDNERNGGPGSGGRSRFRAVRSGEVVADEFAGQSVTFIISPFLSMGSATGRQILITAFAGFVLFRLFDISKPWPIRRLEKYPAGWGILADDLLAGVYAWIVLQICIRFFIV
jgi:hypothetical protein